MNNDSIMVADEIYRQLGGNHFLVMTGTKDLIADGNTLRMRLAKNLSKANRLWVTLDGDDTYTMRFFRYTAPRLSRKTMTYSSEKVTEVETLSGIYAEQLRGIFTGVTGMDTSL